MNNYSTIVHSLLGGAALAYFASALSCLLKRRRLGGVLMAVGWLITLALFSVNAYAVGAPPFGNMYQVQVVLALCFFPLFLHLSFREGLGWTGPYFSAAATIVLVGALFLDQDAHWRRMPALQSAWFVPHVLSYMIAYALAAVAFVLGLVKWVGRRWLSESQRHAHDHAMRQILRIAFPFMTFGLLSGALWADRAWGSYWSWDPKETWSLITWTLYLAYLHCLRERRLRPYADVAHVLGFLALMTTFTLVNLLPRLASVLHGYA